MTIDKQKLKALAEAANAITTDVNITMAIGADPVEVKAVQDYLQVAMPKTILALLAEIEQLRKAHEQVCTNYNRVSFASEERGKQIDQLKAENEALRKDAERYRGVRRVANRQGFTGEQFDQQTDSRVASFDAAMARETSDD